MVAESAGAFGEFAHVEVRVAGLDGRPSAYFVRRDVECAVSVRAHVGVEEASPAASHAPVFRTGLTLAPEDPRLLGGHWDVSTALIAFERSLA